MSSRNGPMLYNEFFYGLLNCGHDTGECSCRYVYGLIFFLGGVFLHAFYHTSKR